MALKYEDVFRPGSFPEYTYISRKSAVSDLSYEFRLEQAIKVSGFLTSLVGPSKMGKTILCEKVIGLEKIVEVSGADFDENTDFWKLAASKVGLAYEGQFSSEKIIPDTRDKYEKKEVYALTKDKIIEYYKQEKLVMVIDDFHYAPPEKARLILAVVDRCLCCRQTGNGYPVGAAGHIVQADLMAEFHRTGISAVLAADAKLQIRPGLSSSSGRILHQLAYAALIQSGKGI